MTEVKVKRNAQQQPLSLEVTGHALFAPHGQDIVCAAVSVLIQTVLFAMEDLLGIEHRAVLKEGYLLLDLSFKVEQEKKEKFYLLVETMLLGLQETARSYPDYLVYYEE